MLADIAGFLQIEPWPPVPSALFWAALALVAGALIGELAARVLDWPRMVGYSAVGMVLALSGHGTPDGRVGGSLRLIVDLALGLLLFELGSRVRLRWLRDNPALLATSALEALLSFGAIVLMLQALGLGSTLAWACATILVPVSGAVVGRIASELRGSGQVTERMVVLAALNTLFAVLAHKLVIGWLHVEQSGDWVRAISQPLYTFAGSVLLAAVLARLVAGVARGFDLRNENAVLLLLGFIVVAQMGARMAGLSTLLLPLMAGVLLRNGTERPWVWPRHFGTAGGVSVLMLFVIVGSAWSLPMLVAGAATAVLVIAARAAAKALAVLMLARFSGLQARQGAALALALLPVSGSSLVLYIELGDGHPALAAQAAPIVLSTLAILELLGPVAVQWALRLAGELEARAGRPR